MWDLLEAAYLRFGPRPTLLERDTNIPPLPELLDEIAGIHRLQAPYRSPGRVAAQG